MTASALGLLISSAIQIASALVFAAVLWHFQRRAGRFYLRFWRWSWLAFVVFTAAAVASRLATPGFPATSPLRIALSIASLTAGHLQLVWLVAGTYELSRRQALAARWGWPAFAIALAAGVALTLVWIGDPAAADYRYYARVGVRVVAAGLAFGGCALWLARDVRRGTPIGWVLPSALLLYGVTQVASFYWALPLTASAPSSDQALRMALTVLEVCLQLLIGLGLLLWLLDRERQERYGDWQRLAESEERYRSLAECATDAIVTFDGDGVITFANSAASTTFGYRPDEMVGQSIALLMAESDREAHLAKLARLKQAGERAFTRQAFRLVARHQTGRDVPIDLSLTEHTSGGMRRISAIARDLTERGRLEEQLLQAQKMQALDRLAGGIAHDFNNLLMAIGGNAELAGSQLDPSHPARPGIVEIRRAAERASELTTKLLAFSRKQAIQRQRLDMNVAVSELGSMLARLISEDITVEIRLTREPAWVDGDPSLIDHVLLNLAINARDAMRGGGRLTLATSIVDFDDRTPARHADGRPGSFVSVRVTDTGTGIDPQHLPSIFEPFFTTKEAGKGTGLGLATTYGVARQHDGWIEVESEMGLGTTFRVFFPRQDAPGPTATASAEPPVAGGRETILLVEDEPQVRAVIRRVLTSYGYTVLAAPDGPAGLSIWEARGHEIDLLLTDVVMPRARPGPDVAAVLRRERPHLRVIFMTGYQADLDLDQVGADAPLLRKPFSLSELARLVEDTLAGAPARSSDGN
jgi:PAS domain S-box-containing protein